MILDNIFSAKFLSRKNRFVWEWILDDEIIKFHIWDTGRLQEVLFPQNEILLQKMPFDGRKYLFRLISAKWLKWNFILLNSLLHSALIREYLQKQKISYIPEVKVWGSKIDFIIKNEVFVEVKWCSLIKNINGEFVAMFPDAPTIRWQKHIQELINLLKWWKQAQIWFLLTNNVNKFKPNTDTDSVFSNLFYNFLNLGWKVKFLYAKLDYWNNQVKINIEDKKVKIL
jgi:sugar fermentation stimulation protein A